MRQSHNETKENRKEKHLRDWLAPQPIVSLMLNPKFQDPSVGVLLILSALRQGESIDPRTERSRRQIHNDQGKAGFITLKVVFLCRFAILKRKLIESHLIFRRQHRFCNARSKSQLQSCISVEERHLWSTGRQGPTWVAIEISLEACQGVVRRHKLIYGT